MIPKIIHYCWFGKGEKNDKIKYCMKSWKKYCPDYEIKEWNEENFDISSNLYCKQAYENKKWAFVSDYVRLYALVNEGGVYLDTDVEITNSFEHLLKGKKGVIGYHSTNALPSALMSSEKGNEIFKYLLTYYDDKEFIKNNGELDLKTNIDIISEMIVNKYQISLDNQKKDIESLTIYPTGFFTEKQSGVENYAIHHMNASWLPKEDAMEQVYRFKSKYNLAIKWTENLIENKKVLNEYLNKRIAIYGNGYLGRLLKKQAINEGIQIKYIIDKMVSGEDYDGIPVMKVEEISNSDIDVIIVTPTYDYKEIKEELEKFTNALIISLEDLL